MNDQTLRYLRDSEGAPVADDEVDMVELFGTVVEHRWLIAAITVATVLLGAAYLFVTPPVYRVDGLLQVEDKQSGIGGLEEMTALFSGETPVNAELEILRSRLVLGQAVDDRRLDILAEPRYFPVVGRAIARQWDTTQGPSPAWLGLRRFGWGGEVVQVDTLDVPKIYEGEDLILVAGQEGRFAVNAPDGSQLLESKVGEPVAHILRDGSVLRIFVARLDAEPQTQFVIRKVPRSEAIDDLRDAFSVSEKGKQSGVVQVVLEGIDYAAITGTLNDIINIYLRQNVERKSKEAEQKLAFLEQQLPVVKERLETAEAVLNSYRLEHGSVDLPAETQSLLQQVVAFEGQITQLRQKQDELLQRFTAAHPTVVALDAQIARLKRELERLNEQVKVLPDTQQEIVRLSRDVEVNTALYNALLNGAQELRVAKAGTVGNARVVDYALEPDEPVKPTPILVIALAFALGGILAVAVAFVKRAMESKTVHDPKVLEQALGLPVYAAIPHSPAQGKLGKLLDKQGGENLILADLDSEDLAIESLRSLRTSLHFMMLEASNNVIMVTGPSPGIGKSFLVMNLGAVLASAGRRVVVVDADMRKGHLNRYVGLPREGGLSECISGQISLTECLYRTPIKELELIPTGVLPPNPAELLMHPRFGELIKELSSSFDLVLVDCPPIMAVTDAAVVGRQAGTNLLLVKAGAHPIREIEQSIKRLQQGGVQVRGFIFNDLVVSRSPHYGYGRYAYQYSYRQDGR